MRIDSLYVKNFKGFTEATFDFHPRFTLLVGENGSGKTSILDALAVSLGIWLVNVPDTRLANSGRNILPSEIRQDSILVGVLRQFQQQRPVVITAKGTINDTPAEWTRRINKNGKRTTNSGAKTVLDDIQSCYEDDRSGKRTILPIMAYYGAGRAWLPSNQRTEKSNKTFSLRWGAFYYCLSESIRFSDLNDWFMGETIARGNNNGQDRSGFKVVKQAIRGCVPGAEDCWWDPDQRQVVLLMDGNAQPIGNLSAGQRMMFALVADIAIKAVTQNAYLLSPDPNDELWRGFLSKVPGVVLIDELDVHLHPRWQRRVATDLKKTFPQIQFVCTSHSPQVIGEPEPDEILILQGQQASKPYQSFGLDSNRVIQEVLGAEERTQTVTLLIQKLSEEIDEERFSSAHHTLRELESLLGSNDPEVIRASTLLAFLEADIAED